MMDVYHLDMATGSWVYEYVQAHQIVGSNVCIFPFVFNYNSTLLFYNSERT